MTRTRYDRSALMNDEYEQLITLSDILTLKPESVSDVLSENDGDVTVIEFLGVDVNPTSTIGVSTRCPESCP